MAAKSLVPGSPVHDPSLKSRNARLRWERKLLSRERKRWI
jgi:hypothetical protein